MLRAGTPVEQSAHTVSSEVLTPFQAKCSHRFKRNAHTGQAKFANANQHDRCKGLVNKITVGGWKEL